MHPDKNGNTEEATEAFKALQEAYEILLDPSKKTV
jgi:DnaJ-class molecular chaperone